MLRLSPDESIPHHFEAVPLRRPFVAVGWTAALLSCAGGLWLAATAYGPSAEILAPFLVVAGALLAVAVVRCRRHELTVGTKRTELKVGPFERIVPTAAVTRVSSRPAAGWRCLFSDREIVFEVEVGRRSVSLPSDDPDAVARAIDELK
ncbi:MAG TPA: hypothetical protein VD788_05720 [Candidatus Polarisedimenticolaceae bacterium]|nr:hypothetical protein [Candidatus Polarisedimenticolaceae bacterium]